MKQSITRSGKHCKKRSEMRDKKTANKSSEYCSVHQNSDSSDMIAPAIGGALIGNLVSPGIGGVLVGGILGALAAFKSKKVGGKHN
jgi:hypothetical protein